MPQEHKYQQNLEEQREFDRENKEKLEANRQKKSLRKLAGEVAREAGISKSESLANFRELRDIFFIVALMSSLLKDILDPLGAAWLGLAIVFAFLASIVTTVAMFICGAGVGDHSKEKALAKKIVTSKWLVLAAGTVFEMIPIVDFLPIQTVTTFIIFIFILRERRWAEMERRRRKATALASTYA